MATWAAAAVVAGAVAEALGAYTMVFLFFLSVLVVVVVVFDCRGGGGGRGAPVVPVALVDRVCDFDRTSTDRVDLTHKDCDVDHNEHYDGHYEEPEGGQNDLCSY